MLVPHLLTGGQNFKAKIMTTTTPHKVNAFPAEFSEGLHELYYYYMLRAVEKGFTSQEVEDQACSYSDLRHYLRNGHMLGAPEIKDLIKSLNIMYGNFLLSAAEQELITEDITEAYLGMLSLLENRSNLAA